MLNLLLVCYERKFARIAGAFSQDAGGLSDPADLADSNADRLSPGQRQRNRPRPGALRPDGAVRAGRPDPANRELPFRPARPARAVRRGPDGHTGTMGEVRAQHRFEVELSRVAGHRFRAARRAGGQGETCGCDARRRVSRLRCDFGRGPRRVFPDHLPELGHEFAPLGTGLGSFQ